MSRRLTGQADGQAGSRGAAAQGPGWLDGPVTRSLAYRRVRWMLAASHALVRYGAVGNITAPGAGGEDSRIPSWITYGMGAVNPVDGLDHDEWRNSGFVG